MTALSCKFVGDCSRWIGVPHVSRTPLQVILVRQVQAALITLTRGMDMRLDRRLPLLEIALVPVYFDKPPVTSHPYHVGNGGDLWLD